MIIISYQLDVSTISIVDNFDMSSEEDKVNGLEFSTDGTKMYMVGSTGNDINEYHNDTTKDEVNLYTKEIIHNNEKERVECYH